MTDEQLAARRAEWEALVRTWWERIMGPAGAGWQIIVNLQSPMDDGSDLAAETCNFRYRTATFFFSPETVISTATACHEVLHCALARFAHATNKLSEWVPVDAQNLAKSMVYDALEEVIETTAQALVRAFGE